MSAQVKWGILGCADIARKFCVAVAEASNATCVAAASRTKEKAEAFIAENCEGARAYGSYDEVIADEDVQAIYIPLPTKLRAEWVLKAAAKKKHILCEKPVGNMRDCCAIIDACREAGVQFMDNTMFMHHDRLAAMRKVLDDEELFGAPKHVASSFMLPFGNEADWVASNIRTNRSFEPLGCLGDLGWYSVRFSLWAFGYEDPESVCCQFLEETSDGVPLFCTCLLKFPGGRTATFDCSFKHALRQSGEVVGQKCVLRVEDFVVPNSNSEASFAVSRDTLADKGLAFPHEVVKTETVSGCVQHTRLVEKFSELVLGGEPDESWPKLTLQTQLVVSALVASARKDGAWIKPQMPASAKAGGKGNGKGKAKAGVQEPIEKKKATFNDVSAIDPDSKGLNLMVKVVSTEPIEGQTPMCSAVIGDGTGIVTMIAKGEEQFNAVKAGASLVLRNAGVRMVKGFVRVQVDRWGKVEVSDEEFTFSPNADNDMSSTEYQLVKE